MRVQEINTNQQAFGIRKITLDDSLIEHASTRVLRAIERAITPEIYAMGGDTVELNILASKKLKQGIPELNNYFLAVRDVQAKGSMTGKPDSEIRDSNDVVELISAALENICPEQMRTAEQILAAANAKIVTLNKAISDERIARRVHKYMSNYGG
jgi:hypothetical protein